MQFSFYRKIKRGHYFLIHNTLTMADFWTDVKIKSCGSIIIKDENHE